MTSNSSLGNQEYIFITHLIIIIKSEVSVIVRLRCLYRHMLSVSLHITPSHCQSYWQLIRWLYTYIYIYIYKMSESLLMRMCYLNFHTQKYRRRYIFTRYCWTLGNIFQTIWIGSFNIIYIRGVNKSIYIIKYISWKWWFIYAYIPKATWYCRYFHWAWF